MKYKSLNMIRRIVIMTAIILSVLVVPPSCTDLDEVVYSELMAEDFTPTQKDVLAVMAPVYSTMRDLYFGWHGYFDMQEECSDIIVTPGRPNGWVDGGVYRRMHLHDWTAQQSHPGGMWTRCYNGINNANRVIYQFEQNKPDLGAVKESYIAELKVARAFYYSLLLDAFGNVPLVTRWDVEEGFLPEQNTKLQVYEFIIKEITDALPVLSDKSNVSTYGRFNKWAAHALLARVYLNAQVYVGTPQWDKVIEMCNVIINSGSFSLDPSYKAIFATNNHTSPEIVFAVPYDELHGPWFHLHMKTLHPQNQSTYKIEAAPWNGNAAIPQFINTYDPTDSRLKDTWIMGPQFSAEGNVLYCNLSASMNGKPLVYVNTMADVYLAGENEGYRIGKYEIKMSARGQLSNDFPVFRYADILMMKAEALLRKGDAAGAATIVTQVRQRAFKDNPEKAAVTGAQLLLGSSYNYGYVENGEIKDLQGGSDIQFGRFLDELGWEFAAESRRRTDLIRFGVFTTKYRLSFRGSQSYRTLFAIPQVRMDTNPKLKQNPGY
jgi:starch-binding outer membrane protein, SusD/RagB family